MFRFSATPEARLLARHDPRIGPGGYREGADVKVEQLGLASKCGFMHIPVMSQPGESENGLPLDIMVEGIESCLDIQRDKMKGRGQG